MKCYGLVTVDTKEAREGRMVITARTSYGCKLERDHEGHCQWWPDE